MNVFTKEGMAYLINSSLGVSVGGAPSPISQFYVGLSLANRNWSEDDVAATINAIANEFQDYTETTRPIYDPQALATPAALFLDDAGGEASFTMGDLSGSGGTITIYGFFIISAAQKNGSSDATATLIAGENFTTPQVMSPGGTLSVGKKLTPSNP